MIDTYERVLAAGHVGPAGIYESNYLKGNAPDGSGAFWLKHNVLVPAAGAGGAPVAEFWCVLWRAADDWQPRVWKQVVPLASVELGADSVLLRGPDVAFERGHARGALRGDPTVRWDLEIADELSPLHHFTSAWMYERAFPRKKLVTSSPRAISTGSFEVGGERLEVDGWIGHRNHNWGTEHAERYAYGGCNVWDDGADLTVEGFTVQVRVTRRLRSPWMTLVRGLDGGRAFGSGTVGAMLRQAGEVSWPTWTAWARSRGRRGVRLEMTLDPAHVAGLRYLHPDGRVSYCYNAKDAQVHLLYGPRTLTSRSGELEFLFPEPLPGIALHGEGTLEDLAAAAAG